MGVPRRAVFELVAEAAFVMVRDVPMVVAMDGRRVGVGRSLAVAFSPLHAHDASFRRIAVAAACSNGRAAASPTAS
jgi:hypothetical protein